MEDLGRFLFNEPVKKVEQLDRTPKRIFILGVYASAVHAKWMSPKGKTLIKALAVASEPYIFWKGDGAEDIIKGIKIPLGAGTLKAAAENFNGPSGKVLDDKYLKPLELKRQDCWLCDLVPYSMLNSNQMAAINKRERIFTKFGIKKCQMREATSKNREIDPTRQKEIINEIKKSKAEYLITLGNEPLNNFVNTYIDYPVQLNQDNYGQFSEINLDGTKIKLLSLVHPRQAGALGGYSPDWYKIHSNWIETSTKKIRKQLL